MSKIYSISEISILNKSSLSTKDNYEYINYLDTSNLTKNKIDSIQFIKSEFPSRAKRKVENNTILYSTVRPNQEHHGIVENNEIENFIVSTGFTTVDVVSEYISPKYLYYKLTQPAITEYLQNIAENSVSAYPSIKPEAIGNLNFRFPDLSTQQKIAAVLSALDDKIELNNKINAELEAMAKTLYDYWFVQFDFPNAEGKPYKSSGGKMEYNETLKREIPKGWEVKSVGHLTALLTRGISPIYIDGNAGIPVLNQKCVRDNRVMYQFQRRHDYTTKGISNKIIEKYDVLVNSTGVGTLGRVAMVRWLNENIVTVDSHVTILRCFSDVINKIFYGYSIITKQPEIENFANGSTGQVELNRSQLADINLLIPSQNLQNDFAALYSSIIEKTSINEVQNIELAQLRDWLLPMLMNGQVKVESN